jgi:hypothetical protein
MNEPKLATDLATFAYWHIKSGDIDPVYPVLETLHTILCDDDEEALRFTLLYVTYYNLPSAIGAWSRNVFNKPGRLPELSIAKYATGTERRAHRMPHKLVEHLDYLDGIAANYGSLTAWLTHDLTDNPYHNWRLLQDRLRSVRHNGRWAAYKTGEILATVHKYPLKPTDAGHDFSSGPRKGLADCYPESAAISGFKPDAVNALDKLTNDLQEFLNLNVGSHVPVEQVETVLCDWHSLLKGGYYVGHDIDVMLEQGNKALSNGVLIESDYDELMFAREQAFTHNWLGEYNDWTGIRKDLKTLYRDSGKLEWWA